MKTKHKDELSVAHARIDELEREIEHLCHRVIYWREKAETAVVRSNLDSAIEASRRAKAGAP